MLNKMRTHFFAMALACLALLAASSPANAQNRVVKIVNEASMPIYHLYVTNVGEIIWGSDQLELYETIAPYHYRVFNMDDGSGYCLFDLRAVLSDGRVATRLNFNVCTQSSWTVTD
jgi:hypothetical protein